MKTWLGTKLGKSEWCYGLVRHDDGSIQLSELHGFGAVGPVGHSGDGRIYKINRKEKRMIIQDLYLECCKFLDKKPDIKGFVS